MADRQTQLKRRIWDVLRSLADVQNKIRGGVKTWWQDICKRADEIDRDVRRRNASTLTHRPVIRNEAELQDETIAQAVSMARMAIRGLREAAQQVREQRGQRMIQVGKSRSDEQCNCQAPSRAEGPWHPLGDTRHCPLVLHGPECCRDCRDGIPTHRASTACECD